MAEAAHGPDPDLLAPPAHFEALVGVPSPFTLHPWALISSSANGQETSACLSQRVVLAVGAFEKDGGAELPLRGVQR